MSRVSYLKKSHRIFGCYVKRKVTEKACDLIVSEYSVKDNKSYFCRQKRFYQNETFEDKYVLVFIDSFHFLGDESGSIHLYLIIEIESYLYEYFDHSLHSGTHLFCETNGGLSMIKVMLDPDANIYCSKIPPITQLYPVILDLDYHNIKNSGDLWTQRLALGLHFSAYWDRYDLSDVQKDGDVYKGLTIDQTHYQSKPIQPDKDGHRMFHRFQTFNAKSLWNPTPLSIPALEKTCVSEWMEEFFKDPVYSDLPPFPQIDGKVPDVVTDAKNGYYKRIAFYVCAGTKLVVLDSYQMPNSDPKVEIAHNRTLVLPGGLVVIDATNLRFNTVMNESTAVFDPKLETPEQCLTAIGLKSIWNRFKGIQNPVFFLGAIESKYNAVVWSLHVNRNIRVNDTQEVIEKDIDIKDNYVVIDKQMAYCLRSTDLSIPDRGFVVAIEEWDTGLAEIMARHQYQQLHRGVTYLWKEDDRSYQTKVDKKGEKEEKIVFDFSPFQIPKDKDLLKKITSPETRDTCFQFDFTALIQTRRPGYRRKPLAEEYRFSTTTLNEEKLKKANVPPLPPAAYPPIHLGNSGGKPVFYYMPHKVTTNNQLFDLSRLSKKYRVDANAGNTVYIDMRDEVNYYLRLQPTTPVDEYLWQKVTNLRPVDPTQDWVIPDNDVNLKLCLDGHWYKKVYGQDQNTVVIGTTTTKYYEIFPFPQKPKKDQGKGKNKSGGQPHHSNTGYGNRSGSSQSGSGGRGQYRSGSSQSGSGGRGQYRNYY